MQFFIALAVLLAIAANEWPSPLVGISDTHRFGAVLAVQALLSSIACCRWGRCNSHHSWYALACWITGSLIVTLGLGWSQWVARQCGTIHVGSAILILVPHLASLAVIWAVPLAVGHGQGGQTKRQSFPVRWSGVWTNLRVRFQWQLLPILLPLLTVLIARDLLEQSYLWHQLNGTLQIGLLSGVSMLGVLLGFPTILKWWLPTQPFADSDFEKQVNETGRRLNLRLRETVEWQTQRRIANAMVLGWLPGTRRILISDTLTWALTRPQLLAVFLHEAGHLKRHHLWWRLSVIVLAGQALLLGSIATERERNLSGPESTVDVFLATLGLIGLLLLTALLMGFVSRALEFEADSFALEQLNTFDSSASENHANKETYATPDDLIAAIRGTAELTGSSPDQITWMHPSISERIERIRLCHASPVVHQVMCRRMRVLKGALIGAITLFAALLLLHGYAWQV